MNNLRFMVFQSEVLINCATEKGTIDVVMILMPYKYLLKQKVLCAWVLQTMGS